MTTPTHDTFAEMAAAYALGALDRDEQQLFEQHLDTCTICQREVAELRRVTGGIGMTADPVAPPDSLKARTIARATAQSHAGKTVANPQAPRTARPAAAPRLTPGWLLAAASLAAAIGTGVYAWSLRSQLTQMQQTMAELSERANTLRNNLDEARRESFRLSQIVEIVQAPGTIQVNLTGTGAAQTALGRAAFNPGRGMVVSTERLPALRLGRAYQTWMIVQGQPMSVGVFTLFADGSGTLVAPLPPNLLLAATAAVTIAVTEEPAGGSPRPTSDPLLSGVMTRR